MAAAVDPILQPYWREHSLLRGPMVVWSRSQLYGDSSSGNCVERGPYKVPSVPQPLETPCLQTNGIGYKISDSTS
jgi:hypothetical protein